jgi:uncharacterized protein
VASSDGGWILTEHRPHQQIRVRSYGELVDLVGEPEASVPFGTPRSVKDLIESIGIPHPEVALIVVDGTAVGFEHRLEGGERVAVYPPFQALDLDPVPTVWPEPPAGRSFVLDVHLGTLTRRLRLLGFDCWYRVDADDADLADVAVAEDRILLSRDRSLLMRRVIRHGYLPRSDDPDDQLAEVVRRYGLAERLAPLTRCVRCNALLVRAGLDEVRERVPPRTRVAFRRYARCPGCEQVYWAGAHRPALEAILERVRGSGAS